MNNSVIIKFILAVLLFRLISLGLYPLMDTTEARYGEMARLMVETKNWLTPQFDYGIPFWGKPPFHTWASAVGIQVFGLSEFALRAPHWLASVLTLFIVYKFAIKHGVNPLISTLILTTTTVFIVATGLVMTDSWLVCSYTLALTCFYNAWQGDKKWAYGGFFGLALGLLVKGPLILVLFGLVVFPWMWVNYGFFGGFKNLWKRIPMITGFLLLIVVAVPWYLMAEKATPGFIDYFIIGEHYSRFVESGWDGDLYGTAHVEPRGKIWLYWLLAACPWSIYLLYFVVKTRASIKANYLTNKSLNSFLILWLISPLVLFTMAGNILPVYILPGIPALALLIANLQKENKIPFLIPLSLFAPVLLVITIVLLNQSIGDTRSDRPFFVEDKGDIPTFYWNKRPFSGQYYSNGKAKVISSKEDLLTVESPFYLILAVNSQVPAELKDFECLTNQRTQKREKYLCTKTQ